MTFLHDPIDLGYSDLTTESVNGKRMYVTPEGRRFPSVTTVLGVRSREGIQKWRARVGEEEANRISSFAASRGTQVHTMVERYIDNREDYLEKSNHLTRLNFETMRPVLDQRIGRVLAQEVPLYSNHLGLAGRVDCVAEFDGRLSIVDFKTSSKPKKKDWIHNYFIQETAYAIMFEERTGTPIVDLVTIIVNDLDEEPQVFQEKRDRWIDPLFDTIEQYHAENGVVLSS
jgi:genome maintenance exonuclease 1